MKYYKNLTKAQFQALAAIAFNQTPIASPKTIKSLLDKGLIIEIERKRVYGKGNSPIDLIPVEIRQYAMPLSEHINFCYWCSKEYVEDE